MDQPLGDHEKLVTNSITPDKHYTHLLIRSLLALIMMEDQYGHRSLDMHYMYNIERISIFHYWVLRPIQHIAGHTSIVSACTTRDHEMILMLTLT